MRVHGFFGQIIGFEEEIVYHYLGSSHFVLYLDNVKGRLAQKMWMDEINLSQILLFIGHVILEHAQVNW